MADTKDQVINAYAEKAQQIYDQQTAGDYTWLGFLRAFVDEYERAE